MVTIKPDELKVLDSIQNIIHYCETNIDGCEECLFYGACPLNSSSNRILGRILNNILERGAKDEKLCCNTCSRSE